MARLLRPVLLVVIALLMLNLVVIGLGTSNTGPIEKVVLVGVGISLIYAAFKVRTYSRNTPPPPS